MSWLGIGRRCLQSICSITAPTTPHCHTETRDKREKKADKRKSKNAGLATQHRQTGGREKEGARDGGGGGGGGVWGLWHDGDR